MAIGIVTVVAAERDSLGQFRLQAVSVRRTHHLLDVLGHGCGLLAVGGRLTGRRRLGATGRYCRAAAAAAARSPALGGSVLPSPALPSCRPPLPQSCRRPAGTGAAADQCHCAVTGTHWTPRGL